MKPSNIYGYLRESIPESDDDDDIQIIEVVQSNSGAFIILYLF